MPTPVEQANIWPCHSTPRPDRARDAALDEGTLITAGLRVIHNSHFAHSSLEAIGNLATH